MYFIVFPCYLNVLLYEFDQIMCCNFKIPTHLSNCYYFMKLKSMELIDNFMIYFLDSKLNDKCIDITIMCVFLFLYLSSRFETAKIQFSLTESYLKEK